MGNAPDRLPEGEPPYELLPLDFQSPRVAEFIGRLKERVIGQPEAIKELAMAVEYSFADLRDPSRPNKPIAVIALLGPSGVGKTESVRAFAEALFGAAYRMLVVDCTQLVEPHEAATLKGSPLGYIGSDEPSQLCQFNVDRGYLEHQIESGEYFKTKHNEATAQLANVEKELFNVRREMAEQESRQQALSEKLLELQAKPETELIEPEKTGIIWLEEKLGELAVKLAVLAEREKNFVSRSENLQKRAQWFENAQKAAPETRLQYFHQLYSDQDDIKGYNRKPDLDAKSIILFDEIDKAHETIPKMLLGVLDDGILTLRNGGTTSFRNSIIFFTSNHGSEEIKKLLQSARGKVEDTIGFLCHRDAKSGASMADGKAAEFRAATKEICLRDFQTCLITPFVGRVGWKICFQPLTFADMLLILDRFIRDFNCGAGKNDLKRTVSCPMTLMVSEELKQYIVKKATLDWEEGARRIYGVFRECVLDALIPLLNGGIIQPYDEVFATLSGDKAALFRRPGSLPPEVHLLGSVS